MIRIIGVGSPFGDDGAGLEAARRLAASPPPSCEIVAADRPGLGLIELLEGTDAVIVIDAVRAGAPPGTLHDVGLRQLARRMAPLASSHAFGVAEALRLAAQLGRVSVFVRVLGIEVGPERGAGGLTAPARAGVRRAVRRAWRWARWLAGYPDRRSRGPEGPPAALGRRERDDAGAADPSEHSRRDRRRSAIIGREGKPRPKTDGGLG